MNQRYPPFWQQPLLPFWLQPWPPFWQQPLLPFWLQPWLPFWQQPWSPFWQQPSFPSWQQPSFPSWRQPSLGVLRRHYYQNSLTLRRNLSFQPFSLRFLQPSWPIISAWFERIKVSEVSKERKLKMILLPRESTFLEERTPNIILFRALHDLRSCFWIPFQIC
jgi:hypothetical protein